MYSDSLFLSLLLSPSVISPVVFPESSLTPENLSTVLDIMSDDLWEWFGRHVNTPESELERIKGQYTSDKECKQALIHSFISSHPAPSWSLVASALYHTESLKALDRLQQLFPTGKVFCDPLSLCSPLQWLEVLCKFTVCSLVLVYIDFPCRKIPLPADLQARDETRPHSTRPRQVANVWHGWQWQDVFPRCTARTSPSRHPMQHSTDEKTHRGRVHGRRRGKALDDSDSRRTARQDRRSHQVTNSPATDGGTEQWWPSLPRPAASPHHSQPVSSANSRENEELHV